MLLLLFSSMIKNSGPADTKQSLFLPPSPQLDDAKAILMSFHSNFESIFGGYLGSWRALQLEEPLPPSIINLIRKTPTNILSNLVFRVTKVYFERRNYTNTLDSYDFRTTHLLSKLRNPTHQKREILPCLRSKSHHKPSLRSSMIARFFQCCF